MAVRVASSRRPAAVILDAYGSEPFPGLPRPIAEASDVLELRYPGALPAAVCCAQVVVDKLADDGIHLEVAKP